MPQTPHSRLPQRTLSQFRSLYIQEECLHEDSQLRGSMNIDNVYQVEHMIRPGETQMAIAKNVFAGGKGLNQSIAIAKAGGTVYHAGVVGEDGAILLDGDAGKATAWIRAMLSAQPVPSGHTVIQVGLKRTKQHHRLCRRKHGAVFWMKILSVCFPKFQLKAISLILQNELDRFACHHAHGFRARHDNHLQPLSRKQYAEQSYPLACVDRFLAQRNRGQSTHTGDRTQADSRSAESDWQSPTQASC